MCFSPKAPPLLALRKIGIKKNAFYLASCFCGFGAIKASVLLV